MYLIGLELRLKERLRDWPVWGIQASLKEPV